MDQIKFEDKTSTSTPVKENKIASEELVATDEVTDFDELD